MSSEAALAEHSVALDALAADVSGKTIALVGNARSLLQAKHGKRIDEADIVIRINSAPTSAPESHGRRTDWHALAIRNSRELKRRVTPNAFCG
jgi:CDP-diacylglycerol pyrophosphatase